MKESVDEVINARSTVDAPGKRVVFGNRFSKRIVVRFAY